MLYELRRYVAVPGRREAILARFARDTLALFERHGVPFDRILLDRDDPDVLLYVCAWDDERHMDDTWAAFLADPDWIAIKAASEAEGPTVDRIERTFLTAWP